MAPRATQYNCKMRLMVSSISKEATFEQYGWRYAHVANATGCYRYPVNRNDPEEYLLSEAQLDLMRDKGNVRLQTRFESPTNMQIGMRPQPWSL